MFCFALARAALAAPVPDVTLSVPSSARIGETIQFTATFDNTSATDPGFGPFIDVVFPFNGADGNAGADTPDGLDFVSATYLGQPLTTTVLSFPDADGPGPGTTGCVAHPYAEDSTGTAVQVCGTAADKLVVIQLPFGSFTNDQPPADVVVTASMSNLADLGVPLTLRARAGFQYGADALDNPTTDPSILSDPSSDSSLWAETGSVTPTLIDISKSYNGPEDETATGPNFPRQYTITVEVADGQTVTDLDVSDFLPDNLAFLSVVSVNPAGTVVLTPPAGVPSLPPNNELRVNFASITGAPGADATITFSFFVPRDDASAARVIDPQTGDDALSADQARAVGDWTPIDPRDAGGTDNAVADPPGPEHTLSDQSIAIQKSFSIAVDTGAAGPTPGDTVEYTLQIQISDFFAFENLVTTDIISDGQRFDTSFTPTLQVVEHGSASAGPFDAANFSVIDHFTGGSPPVPPVDGTQEMEFRISDELITRGLGGQVLGGCVPSGGTGGPAPDCGVFNGGQTTMTIVYRAIVQDVFTDDFPSGDPSVDQGDSLSNSASVVGDVLDEATLAPTGFNEADDSGAGFSIVRGTLTKSIYARNGNTADTGPVFSPGDTVTYRLEFTLPTSDFENLFFEDYLPLPVLNATEITSPFDTTVDATPPPAGRAKFGPTDTFFALSGITPTITTDAVANSVRFFYGDFDDPANPTTKIDILFTVTFSNDPFADGLFLTNQVLANEQNTAIVAQQSQSIVQLVLGEPELGITKGVVASDGSSPVFDAPTGLTGVTIPSGACPRFTTPVTSNDLAATPVDANLSNVDGGDTVTFALVVENTGSSTNGAFDVQIRDVLPPGFSIPPGGLNLCVTDGTGAPIPFVNLGSGLFDPAGGIELIDGPGTGSLAPFSPTGGDNIAVITYDLILDGPGDPAPVQPRETITSAAEIVNFAGSEGGPDHVTAGFNVTNNPDDATVTIADPQLAKAVSSIVPGGAGGGNVTAGDTVTWELTVTLPEGETPGLSIADTLPAGFQFVPGSVVVDTTGFDGTVTGTPTVTQVGQTVTLDFGTVSVNADTPDDPSDNDFRVRLSSLVLDDPANDGLPALQPKTNNAALDWAGNPAGPIAASAATNFGEPQLSLTKTMVPATVDAGDVVTITITANNTGTSPLYDTVITDSLDGNLFDLATVTPVTTPADFTFAFVSPTVTYSANAGTSIAPGGSRTFVFTAQVRNDVVTSSSYSNTASGTGDSQDGTVAEERVTADADTVPIRASSSAVVKNTTATSEPSTDPGDASIGANPPVAVGEVVTFRIVFTMPEGVTRDVILRDSLPAGLEFIPGTATLTRNSTALAAAGDPGGINSAGAGVPVSVGLFQYSGGACTGTPATTGQLCVGLGDVTNSDTDNGTPETYTLELRTVVQNVAGNIAGTTLTNNGRITFRDRAGTQLTVSNFNPVRERRVHVAEPVLSVTKTPDSPTHQGGDTVVFTLVIANTASGGNAASAFDWTFSDTLPADYQSPSVTLVDPGTSGATVAASFTGNTLNGTIDQLDPGESVTVQYQATLDPLAPFGKIITNTATTDATSLPGTNGTGGATPGAPGSSTGERTGAGGVNDLMDSDSATVTVSQPSLTKTTLFPQAFYAIGESATFRLRVGVPVGSETNFVITDVLDPGLSFVSGSLAVTVPPGMSSTNSPLTEANPSFFNYDAGTGTLTFDFGDITVPTAGQITITYATTIDNVLSNQDGVFLDNTATLTFDDPNNPGGTITVGPVTNDTPVRVGEPNLTMTKSITAGAVGSDAGDTVSWEVVIQNTGNTTAYQLDWSDVLPNGLFQITNVAVSTTGNVFLNGTATPVTTAHAHVKTTTNTNDTIDLADTGFGDAADTIQMDAGASLTVTFDSVVMNTVTPGQVLTNDTRASYTSLVGGGRDNSTNPGNVDDDDDTDLNNYEESATQSLTIAAAIAIDKTISRTTWAVGEEPVWVIRVDVIEGTTPALQVTDILPAGLTYLSHTISFGNMGMSPSNPSYNTRLGTGQTVQFDFGDLLNPANGNSADDFIRIEITTRVDNVLANQNGTVLTNGGPPGSGSEVFVEYDTPATRVDFDSDGGTPGIQGRDITVVEPELNVTKTAVPASQSLGDVVTFTVTIQHLASSTADAFDLVLDDTLPAGLTYVAGSATLPPGDVTVAGQNLQFRISSLPVATGTTSFSYQATVDPTAVVDLPISNNLRMTWASIPGATGAPDSGRNGSDGVGGLNDYADSDSATVTPTTSAFIDATKTVADLNGGDVLPGDTLEYTVVLNNTNGAVSGVVFTDTVPAQTTYVAGSLALGTCPPGAVPNDSGAPDLVVNVGAMNPGESCTITFQVTVNAGVATGTVISNQGSVDSDNTVPEPTDEDGTDTNGDQPTDVVVGGTPVPRDSLYVHKLVEWLVDADGSGDITAGDTLRYALVFQNGADTALTNVSLADTIPTGLTYVPGSGSATGGGSVNVSGQALSVSIPSIAAGGTEVALFSVTIDSPLVDFDGNPATETFTNQGTVSSDQTPATSTDGNGDPTDGNQPTTITAVATPGTGAPSIDVEKRWSLASDADGDGLVDPGDGILYTVAVRNTGSSSGTNVFLNDPIPPDTTVVPGSVSTSQGFVISEDPVAVNLGTLNPGGFVAVSFLVTVDAGTPDGTIIPNQATVTGNNFAPEPSDDNGDDADGKNPTLTPVDTGGGAGSPANFAKTRVSTSEPDSAGDTLLIGEVVTYQLALDLPAGTVRQVEFTDTLPAGMAYIAGTARLARTFDTGLHASRDVGGINSAPSGTFVTLAASDVEISGSTLSVFLGDVINSDDDGNAESYVLEYQVVTENVIGNQAGTILQNSATATFWDGLSQPQAFTDADTTITVLEPGLTITLTASPTSVQEGSGATVHFTLTVTHPVAANGASAYDVLVLDPLSSQYTGLNVTAITPSAGLVGVTDLSNPNRVLVSVDEFPPGEQLVIEYEAQVKPTVKAGSVLRNTASVTWTSLPGPQGTGGATPGSPGAADGERIGTTGVNDYRQAQRTEVTVTSAPPPSTGTPGPTPTPTPLGGACQPVFRKAHAGVAAPGEPITYTLTWSNPCDVPIPDVIVTDTLPDGLTLVEALSPDAEVSVSGNTVTFTVGDLTKGPSGRGVITATIDPQVEADTTIINVAGLVDGEGRSFTATDTLKVRGGSIDKRRLVCFLRAQVYSRPGRFISYTARYRNGSDSNRLVLALPASDIEVLDVFPPPTSVEGNVYTWDTLPRTSGKVRVRTRVSLAAQDGTFLDSVATVDAGNGDVTTCTHRSVVRRKDRLSVALRAQSKRPIGRPIRYVARYRDVAPDNILILELPSAIDVAGAVPAPTQQDAGTLVWEDLHAPSGLVKVNGVVSDRAVPGDLLVASVTLSDETGQTAADTTGTSVKAGGTTTTTAAPSIVLSGQKLASPGGSITYTARYRNAGDSDSARILLPEGVSLLSVFPAGGVASGNVVAWTSLPYSSGTLKLNVRLGAQVTGTIEARAELLSGEAVIASDSLSTTVSSAGSAGLTVSATLPSSVTAGLTSDFRVSYSGTTEPGTMTVTLSDGLSPVLTVPEAVVEGSQVTWSGLPAPGGSVKVRVQVDPAAESGSEVGLTAVLSSGGATATASSATRVR